MASRRRVTSDFLSHLTYARAFLFLSSFIVLTGAVSALTYYPLITKLRGDEAFQQVLIDFGEISFLFQTLENVILFVIIIGIIVYFISRSIKHQLDGERVALLWQIQKIKEGDLASRRNLRKNDESHDVMEALHDLADSLKGNKG